MTASPRNDLPPLNVVRMPEQLLSDDRRVITRPFVPGDAQRIRGILRRVCALSDQQVAQALTRVMRDFEERHKNVVAVFEEHFEMVRSHLDDPDDLSEQRRRLIGAYFTMEYAIEAAALFNPSIVPHPDQSRLPAGAVRFIMSLRATGEGHVSSITFRTGVIAADGDFEFDPTSRFVEAARRDMDASYEKEVFFLKLIEMGAYNDLVGAILDKLPERFTHNQLRRVLDDFPVAGHDEDLFRQSRESMSWLAHSNYRLTYPPRCEVTEVVVFPVTENESRGIEDARLVQFTDDDGSQSYYGTYTAYNGFRILPQLFETPNFTDFRISTLNGRYAHNKGIALFPRKVDGWYMMVSRVDGENMFIMASSNLRFWNDAQVLYAPRFDWELVQVGNCGSPLETPEGWLLLTHGVGPMRQYSIGALLLDLESPARVIGYLKEPLLAPNADEREGYVPNVVYSCGAMIHRDTLVLPYAMSDSATTLAMVSVPELLDHMLRL